MTKGTKIATWTGLLMMFSGWMGEQMTLVSLKFSSGFL